MCNGWPNRETWLLANWLAAWRYRYLMDSTIAEWRRQRMLPGGSVGARRQFAAKLQRDVTANVMKIDLGKVGDGGAHTLDLLPAVDWEAIANHHLKMFRDYRPSIA